jgi:hypothetical protein
MNASASGVDAYVKDIFNDAGKKFDAYAGKILQNGRQKIGAGRYWRRKLRYMNRDLTLDQSQLCQSGNSGWGSESAIWGSMVSSSACGVSARVEDAGDDPVDKDVVEDAMDDGACR